MEEIKNSTLLTTTVTLSVARDRSKDIRPQSSVFFQGNALRGQDSSFFFFC